MAVPLLVVSGVQAAAAVAFSGAIFAALIKWGDEWLLDALLWIPRKLFEALTDEAVLLVEAIPCANACYQVVNSAATVFSGAGIGGLPGDGGMLGVVLHWLGIALYTSGVVVGLELVLCALLARFLLRRIPLIG